MYSIIEHNAHFGIIENDKLYLFNTKDEAKQYAKEQAQELITLWEKLEKQYLYIEERFDTIFLKTSARNIFAEFVIMETKEQKKGEE